MAKAWLTTNSKWGNRINRNRNKIAGETQPQSLLVDSETVSGLRPCIRTGIGEMLV